MKKLTIVLIMALAAVLLATEAFATPSAASHPGVCAPGFPLAIHVGWVTAYAPASNITIEGSSGELFSFALSGNIKILPQMRAAELGLGSRVTVLAKRDPSACSWTAFGIVVHPAGSGAGSLPPTATPTVTSSPTATDTATFTATATSTDTQTPAPTDTSVATDTPAATP